MHDTLSKAPQSPATTESVFAHHLSAFAEGLDALVSDYSESSVIVTPERAFSGLDEIRGFFKAFLDGVPAGFWDAFKISARSVHGDVAYLVWSADPWVTFATDTLVIRDSKIHKQTFTSLTA